MTKNLVVVDTQDSVKKAAILMKEFNVDSVLAVNNNSLRGILTKGDIVFRVVTEGLDARKVPVREVMTVDPIAVDGGEDIDKVIELFEKHGIKHLPVLKNNELIGIVSEGDIIEYYPDIVEITKVKREFDAGKTYYGICENCGYVGDGLKIVNGELLCEECRGEL